MIPFSHRFLASIKTATKHAVEAVGDFRAAAGFTRVQKSQLEAYASRHQPTVIPLDVAIDMDRCAEQPILLSEMAHALGYVVLPMHVGPGDFGRDMSEYSMVSGDMVSTAIRILEDGVIDPQEANEIAPKMAKTKHVLERALARIHTIQQTGQPFSVKGQSHADD
ncbi:hypothetical protein ACJRO0_10145 [Acetobacter oryzifermentans]|uniref:hypothetical protein n=1 Tax=Acetobacter oryzifermentans TaxID=1633874 RepID=UPI0039BED246